ncbi:beta-ketoacyl-ACP reductase [Burkholderia diffusa]|uniref:Beta-ketoacyl-ACP reductase n=1 Tax=Burkholderia diffusa TaxID=488732 RepID=A0AAW3PA65_9BURK|nr:3-oxoacyl-ACP reductase FabG [Burkholderia diffusa]KWF32821.1 beta-ketoacyl-ACP reductase [Burkholderia diffusa]KWF38745.1 beta-ketoacyl-ACP reductase [Burkholderia diffusa]KWF46790.1 beta-ketoacyl-ACP reductase [Burkholderia diffusa]KWF50640.1 beta-ketoacyl-ACP reductase [Burkholderia diffusa]
MTEDGTKLLDGKVAIVTGAAQGIGLAIAESLLAHGASVMIADVDEAQARSAALGLNAASRVSAMRCDVTKAADHEALVNGCITQFGRVDILVNNAGITRDSYIAKMSEDAFDAVIGVSLKGAWLGTRAVAPLFREQRSGNVINVTSLSGKIGNPGQTNYSSAKAGMIGLTKAAAKELGSAGVRVNAVMPGLIRTAMTLAMKPEIYAAKEKEVPLQRAGTPEEVAGAVVFLASPLANYVTGAVIEVTGGRGI